MFLILIAFVAGLVVGAYKQAKVLRKIKSFLGFKDRVEVELDQLGDQVEALVDRVEPQVKAELKKLKAKIKAALV